MLSTVQKAAYELIQSDARFLYSLVNIQKNAKNINSNYIMMSQPYIGIFTDGAEQWCRKVGLDAPRFTEIERAYKLFEKSYGDYMSSLMYNFNASDTYFYKIRSLREKIWRYYNVGTDLCDKEFCGNTILCMLYTPIDILTKDDVGPWIKKYECYFWKTCCLFWLFRLSAV